MKLLSNKWEINPARAFARARIYAVVILISTPFVLAGLIPVDPGFPALQEPDYLSAVIGQDAAIWTLLLSSSALIAAAFGAAFTIMIGWRSDRLQVAKLKREIYEILHPETAPRRDDIASESL
ncbi:MAG: hypothetical protein WDN46_09300 [Methylocella sp.]